MEEMTMRLGSLILFLVLILAPVWLSVGEAVQIPAPPLTPPQEKPAPTDKADPLFQEFLKEVEKSGPMLRDPVRPSPGMPLPNSMPGGAGGVPHPPQHGPISPEQQQEMRWHSLEQLLRNAREIRAQADFLRSIGQAAQADHLNQLADELRRTAIQVVPAPH
jgi:hypothetical protein